MLAKIVTSSAGRIAAARAAPALFTATRGHCQVPCGIFDDPVRVELMKEDAATVRKAMIQINELAGTPSAQSLNQVRTHRSLPTTCP